MSVLHQRLLKPRSKLAVPSEHNAYRRHILGGLPEIGNLAGAERGIRVENGNRAVLAVDEVDFFIWVVGFDEDDELGVEAEIGLDIEGVDVEVCDLVRRDLGIEIREEEIAEADQS